MFVTSDTLDKNKKYIQNLGFKTAVKDSLEVTFLGILSGLQNIDMNLKKL